MTRKIILFLMTTLLLIGHKSNGQTASRQDKGIPDFLFAINSSQLENDFKDSLETIYTLMILNPNLVVEVSGHSNYDEINPDTLSKMRALNTIQYLVNKGVARDRLVSRFYGTKLPYVIWSDDYSKLDTLSKITIEQNAKSIDKKESLSRLNRRVNFSIISKDYHPK